MLRPLVLLLFLLLPAGCAALTDPDDDPAARELARDGALLAVDRARYSVGDTVLVTLTNPLDQPIGHNLCISEWERWTGSEWRRIAPLRSCILVLNVLEEGDEATHEEPTAGWEPGRYRWITTVELMESGERVEIRTGEFTLVP